MLQKSKRIRRGDFAARGRQKLFVSSPLFSAIVYMNKNPTGIRFACVIGGNITKNKPLRNKIKRQVYHLLRPYTALLPQNADIIVFPQKEVLDTSFDSLKRELELLFIRLKLLKRGN